MNNTDKNDMLITGGTGQLGPQVIASLIQDRGVRPGEIFLLVRNEDRARHIMEILGLPHDELRYILADIDTSSMETINGKIPESVKEIIHMAGTVKFGETDRKVVTSVNLFGAARMATLAKERNAEFIHTSTAYVLGRSDQILTESELKVETDCRPKNPYEEVKGLAEKLLNTIHGNNQERYVLVRPSILTDSEKRPDIEIPHATMGYFYPFILLRKKLMDTGISGWVDLENLALCGKAENTINIVDNKVAGKIIAELATDNNTQRKTIHVVNKNPPTYRELTSWVLGELGFTGYVIENQTIQNTENNTKMRKISDIDDKLARTLRIQYKKSSEKNYIDYVTHSSKFEGGIETNNEKLAKKALHALMSDDFSGVK